MQCNITSSPEKPRVQWNCTAIVQLEFRGPPVQNMPIPFSDLTNAKPYLLKYWSTLSRYDNAVSKYLRGCGIGPNRACWLLSFGDNGFSLLQVCIKPHFNDAGNELSQSKVVWTMHWNKGKFMYIFIDTWFFFFSMKNKVAISNTVVMF